MKRPIIFSLLFLLLWQTHLFAQEIPARPANYSPINDFAGMLEAEEVEALNAQLLKYEKETSVQIVVVTAKSLGGKTIETFANELFNFLGIGQKGTDNGILLLIAKNDRKMRIETGYGVEPYVTDIEAKRIIDDILTPAFKKSEFGEGIELAIAALLKELGVANFEPVLAKAPKSFWDWLRQYGENLGFLVLALPLFLGVLISYVSKYVPKKLEKLVLGLGIIFYAMLPAALLMAFFRYLLSLFQVPLESWILISLFLSLTAILSFFMLTGRFNPYSFGSSRSYGTASDGSYSDYSDSSDWGGGSSGGGGASGSW